jgi:hypothetical protein
MAPTVVAHALPECARDNAQVALAAFGRTAISKPLGVVGVSAFGRAVAAVSAPNENGTPTIAR